MGWERKNEWKNENKVGKIKGDTKKSVGKRDECGKNGVKNGNNCTGMDEWGEMSAGKWN